MKSRVESIGAGSIEDEQYLGGLKYYEYGMLLVHGNMAAA
jgi:hypothetical protein